MKMPQKKSHKLWNAESNNGKVMIKRTEAEREEFDPNEFSKAVVASIWGVYGANMYDEIQNLGEIKEAIKPRFASVMQEMKTAGEESPKVFSWEELRQTFGNEKIAEIRGFIANGIKVRRASKALDLPFVSAADLVDDLEVVGIKAMTDIVNKVKNGHSEMAIGQYGKLASKVAELYEEAKYMPKFAVDQAAKDYWESYYGDFGKQLVKEVKKRIKADIAYEWMVKNGVDEVAAKYWQDYFSEGDYGKKLTSPKEKEVKPKDKKKEKKAFVSDEIEGLIKGLGQYATRGSAVREVVKVLKDGEIPSEKLLRQSSFELDNADAPLELVGMLEDMVSMAKSGPNFYEEDEDLFNEEDVSDISEEVNKMRLKGF